MGSLFHYKIQKQTILRVFKTFALYFNFHVNLAEVFLITVRTEKKLTPTLEVTR